MPVDFDARIRRGIFGCLIWTGPKGRSGPPKYGRFYGCFAGTKAHRYAYERARGPIPAGLVIDHLCRNPLCQNPWHMEVVTQGENARRGDPGRHNRIKTECPKGHRYSIVNTYQTRDGRRQCRPCARERMHKAHKAKVPA